MSIEEAGIINLIVVTERSLGAKGCQIFAVTAEGKYSGDYYTHCKTVFLMLVQKCWIGA